MDWIHLTQEHSNEPSGSIKYWECLEWMIDCQLLKKDPATWSK